MPVLDKQAKEKGEKVNGMGHITRPYEGLYEVALFAGSGGGILGGYLLGWRTVCAVEVMPYPIASLVQRQNDEVLAPFPVWDDIRSFTKRNGACRRVFRNLRKVRDNLVISGGFPCQDISSAGKQVGITGERSGLWGEMARTIREIRPKYAFVENSPNLTWLGLDRVLGDLDEIGYDAVWDVLSAADVGAPHVRERIWILAKRRDDFPHSQDANAGLCQREEKEYSEFGIIRQYVADTEFTGLEGFGNFTGEQEISQSGNSGEYVRYSTGEGLPNGRSSQVGRFPSEPELERSGSLLPYTENGGNVWRVRCGCENQYVSGLWPYHGRGTYGNACGWWWEVEPDVGRVVDGLAARVDRIRAIGNGQVPLVAAVAFDYLFNILEGVTE